MTATMTTARGYHTATVLQNGQVLVAGGLGSSVNYLRNAELYNPTTGEWTAVGSLNKAREFHTATLLPTGQVLVAGGDEGSTSILGTAELYDPSSQGWSLTGSLNIARAGHTAALLANGQVLVAGGGNGSGSGGDDGLGDFSSAELYDPSGGNWMLTGSLNTARAGHTATLLPDGKALAAAGGQGSLPNYLSSAEVYDPNSGTWTTSASLNIARYSPTATLLHNGKVLVVGGEEGSASVNPTAELYDPTINPATGTWTVTGSLNTARNQTTATLLPNGQVLVAGGVRVRTTPLLFPALSYTIRPVRIGR
jgi:hypothetical protein